MKIFALNTTLWLLLALLLFNVPASAEKDCSSKDFVTLTDGIKMVALPKAVIGEKLPGLAASEPLASPSAVQLLAPSEGGSTLTTVNRPDFSSLIGMAVENGLVDSSKGVYTISLTPFSFLTLARPEYLFDQSLYAEPFADKLRRVGGKISLGGKGDSLDRDGDGKPDEALEAKKLTDIVTWEVMYRIYGSRDRRDPNNFDSFDRAVYDKFSEALDAEAQLRLAPGFKEKLDQLKQDPPNSGCYSKDDLDKLLKQAEYAKIVGKIKASDDMYAKAAEEEFKKIDNQPVITLVAGGTQREQVFGPNKRSFALRGAWGIPGWNGTHTADLSWSKVEWSGLTGSLRAPDAKTYKVGYEFSTLWLKGTALSTDGITVALSGSSEWLRNDPMAKHGQNAKINARLTIPVSKSMSIPISVTWANHKDLLTEDKVQGHIGFTLDLSQLTKKAQNSSN